MSSSSNPLHRLFREHWRMRFIHSLIVLSLFALSFWAIESLAAILIPGFLIAFLLKPVVDRLEAYGINRALSAILALAITSGLIAGAGFLLIPSLVEQLSGLNERKDDLIPLIKKQLVFFEGLANRYLPEGKLDEIYKTGLDWIEAAIEKLVTQLPALLTAILAWLSNLFFALVVAFMLLEDSVRVRQFILGLVPNRYFEMVLRLGYQLNTQMGGYIRGQSMDCLLNGICYAGALTLMGIQGGIAAGLLAGCLNAIPYAGPVMGALLVILVDFANPSSPTSWWWIPTLFAVVQVLDNVAFYPMTVGKSLNLSPLVVILAILFGGKAAGVLGVLLAVPVLAMASSCFVIFHNSLKSHRILQ